MKVTIKTQEVELSAEYDTDKSSISSNQDAVIKIVKTLIESCANESIKLIKAKYGNNN